VPFSRRQLFWDPTPGFWATGPEVWGRNDRRASVIQTFLIDLKITNVGHPPTGNSGVGPLTSPVRMTNEFSSNTSVEVRSEQAACWPGNMERCRGPANRDEQRLADCDGILMCRIRDVSTTISKREETRRNRSIEKSYQHAQWLFCYLAVASLQPYSSSLDLGFSLGNLT